MSLTDIFRPTKPRKRTINVRVMIDTDSIPRAADRPGDAAKATSIAKDQAHMVVTASREVENQGTGDVTFEAGAGDTLRFFISSGSNNFEVAVLLVDVQGAGGDEILTSFTNQTLKQTVIAPQSLTDVLPARNIQKQFRFCQCVVNSEGTGIYDLVFALFDRNEDGQPQLIGHYRWAMQLTANFNRRKS